MQLNTISLNGSQPLRQACLDGNSILGDCASRQHNHLIDRFIEIKTMLSRRRFTDPVDDVSGSIGIAHDTAKRFPDLAQVWRLLIQKIEGRAGVVAGGGDWLCDFVRQRGGQFPHHAHAVHVGEIRLHLLQSHQRSCTILDVHQQNVPAHDAPGVIANWDAAVFKPPIFAVEAPQA